MIVPLGRGLFVSAPWGRLLFFPVRWEAGLRRGLYFVLHFNSGEVDLRRAALTLQLLVKCASEVGFILFGISTLVKWASEEGFSHFDSCEVLFQIMVKCVPLSRAFSWKFGASFS